MKRQDMYAGKECLVDGGRAMGFFWKLVVAKRMLFFLMLFSPVLLCSLLWAQADPFKIIVHGSNPVTSMTTKEVSRLFLKKETRWEHGFRVTPVDQVLDSPTGTAFSRAVHGQTAKEIKGHWMKIVFSGLGTPPMQLKSDQEVLDFVSHNVGAIGYVCAETSVGDGVKVVKLSD